MNDSQLAALNGVLDEIEDFLEQREDVRDGTDGPRPNAAMSLLSDLRWWRTVLPTKPEAQARTRAGTTPTERKPSAEAAAEYAARNPLGGPAKVFEAMAERIRAGEEYYSVLDDYGFQVKPSPGARHIDRSDAVNLARNVLDTDKAIGGITDKGVKALAEAVLRMDEYISKLAPEARRVDVESRDFYELCQRYRFSKEWIAPGTVKCFEDLKRYITTGELPWPSYEEPSQPQNDTQGEHK